MPLYLISTDFAWIYTCCSSQGLDDKETMAYKIKRKDCAQDSITNLENVSVVVQSFKADMRHTTKIVTSVRKRKIVTDYCKFARCPDLK